MGTPSPKHTAEFKRKAVVLYGKSGTTYAEVARGLGYDPGSLSDWVKKADAADFGTGDNPFQMAEDLRRRVARERDAFKSERLLRQQAAVGESAKRAKLEFISLNEGAWPVSEMCAALKVTRQGHCAWKRRPPSAHAMRDEELAAMISQVRAEVRDIYGAPKVFLKLRRSGVRTSRKRVARIMRERGWRGVARVRQTPLGRETRIEEGLRRGPGQAQVRSRRTQQGVVRRHHLREDPAGLAVPGPRDGHMVEAGRGLGHGAQHHGRAGRRGAEDGPGQEGRPQGMHTPRRPRLAVRVAAALQDHARARHPPLDGLDIITVGQRRHGVAYGPGQVGGRARTGLSHARRGGAGPVRVHRGHIQPCQDAHGAGRSEPRGVRRGQLAGRRRPPEGGVEGVNGFGVDSVRLSAARDEPVAFIDLTHRSTVLLPRSYSAMISRLGLPALYRSTVCLLNSSVKCLGCPGSLICGPPVSRAPHGTVHISVANPRTSCRCAWSDRRSRGNKRPSWAPLPKWFLTVPEKVIYLRERYATGHTFRPSG